MPDRRDESRHPWSRQRPGRRLGARDALVCIGVCALLLVLFEGRSILRQGQEMSPGAQRAVVLAVGRPAAWLAGELPLAKVGHRLTGWLSPNDELAASAGTGFDARASGGEVGAVTPDAFDPAELGERPPVPRPLRTLLVTGDSLVQPLDLELARQLAGGSVRVVRDPHIGTGISKTDLVDWGRLSVAQVHKDEPDAVVVFLGANEGFSMRDPSGREVDCCGADWAAVYATRVRRVMDAYRRRGAGRVYWLLLPAQRDGDRQRVARTVDAAILAAAAAYRAQVRVLDLRPLLTPGDRYSDAATVDGREQIVREPDGIHLNAVGSRLVAGRVVAALRRDFRF